MHPLCFRKYFLPSQATTGQVSYIIEKVSLISNMCIWQNSISSHVAKVMNKNVTKGSYGTQCSNFIL